MSIYQKRVSGVVSFFIIFSLFNNFQAFAAETEPTYVKTLTDFDWPHSAAADSSGNIYITDRDNDRVKKYDSSGSLLLTWGSSGSGDGQFSAPLGIAIDSNDQVYIVDRANTADRIEVFDSSGNFLRKWGSHGTGNGQFMHPIYIAIDSNNYVYVADDDGANIQKFTSTGTYVSEWGTSGTGDGQFNSNLRGLVIDAHDEIYASTSNTLESDARIQVFNTSGTFLRKWGTFGEEDGQFYEPSGLTVDRSGNIYSTDWQLDRIQKFSPYGTYLATWGSLGTGNLQMSDPRNVLALSDDLFLVMDTDNDRVQVLRLPSAGVSISQSSISLTEGGGTVSYTIALSQRAPGATTTVVVSNGNSEVSPTPATLTFTPSNWETAQTVTISAVNDTDPEGVHTATIYHSVSSADAAYNALSGSSVSVSITDNDFAGGGPVQETGTSGGGGSTQPPTPPAPTTSTTQTTTTTTPATTIPTPISIPAVSGEQARTILPHLTGPFRLNAYRDQTKILQELLALDATIYPEGFITGYYGPLTRKAIERFQTRHGIITEGTPDTTGFGYAGPKTRDFLKTVFGVQ